MLIKLLKAERMKLRRTPIWIAFFLMPIVPALLGSINYTANIEMLQSEWYSLWTQHTIFTSYFFLPILLGVYCSYLMHMEHNNNNWNKVLTFPVSRSLVFVSKLITVSAMLLLTELWIGVLFIVSGKLVGLPSPAPYSELIIWCLFGTLGGMVMASIQLMISLFIRSFALPVGIALGGGLSGLVFLAKKLGHIWPYSLMAYGMNANSPQEILKSGYVSFVMICVAYIVVFTAMSSVILSKKDI